MANTKSFVLRNVSTDTCGVFGVLFFPGEEKDLFQEVQNLEEETLIDSVNDTDSTLSVLVDTDKKLKVVKYSLSVLKDATVVRLSDMQNVRHPLTTDEEIEAEKARLKLVQSDNASKLESNFDKTKKTSQINHMLMHMRTMKAAMSGKMELFTPDMTTISGVTAMNVNYNDLNSTDQYIIPLRVWLKTDKYNDPHLWANFDAVASGTEDVADASVTAPTCSGLSFSEGKMVLMVYPDVASGVKEYVEDDSFGVTVKVSDDSTLLGYAVDDLELTFNVVSGVV